MFDVKIVTIILVLLCGKMIAQQSPYDPLPVVNGKIAYIQVFEAMGLNDKQIAERAGQWLTDIKAENIKSDSIQIRRNRTTAKSALRVLWGPNDFKELYRTVSFRIEIISKTERFQIKLYDLRVREPGSDIHLEAYKTDYKKDHQHNKAFYTKIHTQFSQLIEELNSTVTSNENQ